ncbi:MAG: hypothetical protein ACTSQE_01990 [Candidatus Heimdallarchaeaceae archaeon]
MENFTQFIIKMCQIAILAIMLYIFSYRSLVKKISGYKYLIYAIISAIFQGIIETFFYFTRNVYDPETSLITRIEYIPYTLVFLFLLLHFEHFMYWKFRPMLVSLVLISAGFTAYLIDLTYGLDPISITPNHVPNPMNDRLFMWIFDAFQLYAIIVCLIASSVTFFNSIGSKAQYQTLLLWLGFLTSLIVGILEFLEHLIPIDTYGAIGFSVAIGIVLLLYVFDNDFVYITTAKIHNFLIIHENGTTLFSAHHIKAHPYNSLVIGGVINAFTSFINEITGAPDQFLKNVELEKRFILASRVGEIVGLLIVDKKIKVFEDSLCRFVTEFYQAFEDQISQFSGDASIFDTAIDFIPRIFPYIERDDLKLD